ncbi:MAG: primosomal protein N' [Candidatus Auribacterota bacterium]
MKLSDTIAHVVFEIALDREFDYKIPVHLLGKVGAGCIVQAPFGERVLHGFVVKTSNSSSFPSLKELQDAVSEKLFIETPLFKLAQWMSSYYACPLGLVLKSMYPSYLRKTMRNAHAEYISLNKNREDVIRYMDTLSKRAKRQLDVLEYILQKREVFFEMDALCAAVGCDKNAVERLIKKELLARITEDELVKRDSRLDRYKYVTPINSITLNLDQQRVLNQIEAALDSREFVPFVLHGVTGSGKTEVYIRSIQRVLERGQQAIMLIPEISLTPQTEERFRKRFGNVVSVFHSRLSDGARAREWKKMRDGKAKLVVGARSALFAPFSDLGLIVVDEEHERSYKQEESPRYHARDIAVLRAKLSNIPVILGSATPALETIYNVYQGKYTLLKLPARVDDRQLPEVILVDLAKEVREEKKWVVLSVPLKQKISDRLDKGEQVILFLNRRGFSSMAVCQQCGYIYECDDCSITLTYHKSVERLMCHFCGKMITKPVFCGKCGSSEIKFSGIGTQKVERALKAVFPEARVLRMDSDTTTHKDSHFELLTQFRRGKADVLIGTQMIAKGLDFPRVTLVGTIIAESTLCLPDFRAAETTFQLLTQVAGRSGRGEIPGEVVIQTFMKDHPAIVCALQHDYDRFVEGELKARKELLYPPFYRFINIIITAKDKKKGQWAGTQIAQSLIKTVSKGTEVKGPLPSMVHRKRAHFYWHVLLKTNDVFGTNEAIKQALSKSTRFTQVRISVDVDPYYMW